MLTREAPPVYSSGDWDIDLGRRELRLRGVPYALGGRAFEIVEVLVQSAGGFVAKVDLMRAVWPGAEVEENTLYAHIWAIRKALGRDRELLKTVPGRGYRLLGNWTIRGDGGPSAPNGGWASMTPSPTYRKTLPTPPTALIGRGSAVAHLVELMSAARMVTLTGPGGIGKTVLALETARTVLPVFEGGVCFVDLALVTNSALVPSIIGNALNVRSGDGELSHASLVLALGAKQALIILDNCEHVIDVAARIAEMILRAGPKIHVLATSREVLRINGEVVFRVSPLSVPDEHERDPDLVVACSAARLLIERTRAIDEGFRPDRQSASDIAAICRRLDGIPLALEIAAARVATLGLTEVSSRLDGQFDHLFGGMRTALPRHQTLRATLEWSYALLGEEERALLRRLSIFAGYFTMRSVMRVASGVGADPANIPDIVGSLVTKSLLSSNVAAPDAQYRMLKTTRDFALELLRADGEYDIIARRHVEYCCDEIKDVETDAGALSDGQWLQRYGNSLDDVRNALFWSLEQGNDRELGAALTSLAIPLWARFSLFNDCRRFIQGALTLFDQQSETGSRREMQLLAALSNILMNTAGPAPETIDAAQRARKIAEAAGDIDYQLRTIQTLWNGCFSSGEIRKSEQLALTFQQIAKASRDPSDDLLAHRLYATSQFYLGNLSDAEKHIEQMLAGYAALPHGTNFARFGVAQLASARALQLLILLFRGFPDQAIKASEECVSEALRTRNALTICSVISSTCISTALLIGDCESANRYTSIVLEHAERAGLTRWHELGRCFQAIL